jgi:hypothetical protein
LNQPHIGFFFGVRAFSGCNLAGTFIDISISDGVGLFEGDSWSFTAEGKNWLGNSADVSSGTWSVYTEQSGHYHKNPVYHCDGAAADITFYSSSEVDTWIVSFWAPGNAEEESGDCVANTTVNVMLPSLGGYVDWYLNLYLDVSLTIDASGADIWKIEGITSVNVVADLAVVCVPSHSPFYSKLSAHEEEHYKDFETNKDATAKLCKESAGTYLLVNGYLNKQCTEEEYDAIKASCKEFVKAQMSEWTESNAYGVSNEIWPYCAYQTVERECSNEAPE